ncbi:hydantoinase B/oxoprolinase family protein [Plastoroseomonas hellenica]|uniref:hydantoinase B/oxoprolinase family protein n=1 Tax=Plastoroseomonas hellenica TaxID=2687306 RepID=UPI001BA58BA7|nr:hydantoinase B/oxoprolinase family protein [Plastoroseomonas hellenica]MBR0646033.1 hydantoinase B/oxoprolinase family protein [Plastoroseomonas hellenica]
MRTTFDAVTLELLWTRLISVVDEAAAALLRTSFSTIVRESHDFACVLADARGHSLVQATDGVPSFLCTVPRTIRHFLDEYPPETLAPGDILATNDIWMGTGHLPDITVAKPIFLHGRLVGFAGSAAHAPDIGGRIRTAESREVFEEGLQIPPMKVMRAGVLDDTFARFLRKNTRVPDQVMGDLFAQFTALDLMERRLLALMAEHGLDSIEALADEIQGRSERATRAAIRQVPDGLYRAEVLTDGLAEPIRLVVALRKEGDAIHADYAGTDPQVPRGINVCFSYTFAYTAFALKAALCPEVPNNEGAFRPITVDAPLGCILNSTPPAAGANRALTGHFLPPLILSALAQAIPRKVIAGVGSPLWSLNYAGTRDDGSSVADHFFMNGGYGASAERDGPNVLSWPSNVSAAPIEMIEQNSGFRVHHRRLRSGSGGRGAHRGGTGQEWLFENRSARPVAITFMAERTKLEAAAPGLAGGEAGAPGAVLIDGVLVDPKRQHILEPGSRVALRTPGGGGFGPPAARDAAAEATDREDGLLEGDAA